MAIQPLFFDIFARDKTKKVFDDLAAQASGLGRNFKDFGKSYSMYVTAPIVAAGALTLRAAADFEESMNAVNAAAGGLDASSFEAVRDLAIDLGAATQYSASEAAEAIENLIKNGLTASQVLDGAAAAAVNLAGATGGQLAPAADVVTDVMAQFNKQATELGNVADQVSGVLVASKMGFDDYRLAIGQAGGVAGKLGVSFEDMNAALAATSAAFNGGSDAGTSFKTFLQRLVPQTGDAAGAMEQLGLEFFDAEGKMKSMAAIAEELKTGLAGLSDEQRIAAMTDIFGTDAMRTAIMLGEQGADGINRFAAAIDAVDADSQAAARMQGFNGAMRELTGAIESLQIAIADSGLLRWATDAVIAVTGFVRGLVDTNPEILKWGTVVAGLAALLGPVIIGLGALAAAIGAIGIPVAAAIVGVVALGAAFAAWSGDILPVVTAVWDSLAGTFGGPLSELLTSAGGALAAMGEAAGATLSAIGALFQQVFGVTVGEAFTAYLGFVNEFWTTTASVFGEVAGRAIIAFVDVVTLGFETVTGVLKAFTALLAGDFSGALSLYDQTFRKLWGGLGAVVSEAFDGLGELITERMDVMRQAVEVGATAIGEAFVKMKDVVIDAIVGMVTIVSDYMVTKLNAVWDTAKSAVQGFGDAVYNLYDAVAGNSYIPDMVDIVEDEMVNRLGGVWRKAEGDVERTKGVFEGLGTTISNGLRDTLKDGVTDIREFAELGAKILEDMAGRILDSAFRPLETALNQIFAGPQLATATAGGVPLPLPKPAVAGVGEAAAGGLLGGIGDAIGSLFAGFFAGGGFVPPGQWGVAGESGAEPVYGGRTGLTVVPHGSDGGGPAAMHFTLRVEGNGDKELLQRAQLVAAAAVEQGLKAYDRTVDGRQARRRADEGF